MVASQPFAASRVVMSVHPSSPLTRGSLLLAALFAALVPSVTAQQPTDPTTNLKPYVVTAQRVNASDTATHDVVDTYDATDVEASGAFSVEEFVSSLPDSPNGDEVLVLVNGVETSLSLSALSPAMIKAIEVSTNGSMPAYGAYARGRVINIQLKEDYSGRELGIETSGSAEGDGWQRQLMISGGAFRDKWRVMYSARFSRQDAVTADARDFSRQQDRRASGGRDYRIAWGEAPVIRAADGNLAGIVDASGNPVAIALVPENFNGVVGIGDLLPANGVASGQRYFNTSPYLYLSSPSERSSANFQLQYAHSTKLNLSFEAGLERSDSTRLGPPPVTPASATTRIPGALNPFGQDIEVGMVHTLFGPVINDSSNTSLNLGFTANGNVGDDWRWNAQLGWRHRESDRSVRELDLDEFSAALANPNDSLRFDPLNPAANAGLYPTLAVERTQSSLSDDAGLRLRTNGALLKTRTAGPIKVAIGGNARVRSDERDYRDVRGQEDGSTFDDDFQYSLQSHVEIPLVRSTRPGLRRIETRVHGEFSERGDGAINHRRGFGLVWSPAPPVVFRASHDQSISEPGDFEEEEADIRFAESLMDPLRTPAIAQNVQVITRRDRRTRAGRNEERELSVTLEPRWARGLRFTVEYEEDIDRNSGGSRLDAQDVIDNESLFIGRVLRADPTDADLAFNQPGAIVAVDTTSVEVAARERSRLDFTLEYKMPEASWGRFRISATARHVLDSVYELESGTPVFTGNDNANPPDWTGQGSVHWSRRNWSASSQVRYTAATATNAMPAMTDVSANVGYRFAEPLWGKFGDGLQIRGGVRNFRSGPYLADTLLGYRGGPVLGQTFFLSARLPL